MVYTYLIHDLFKLNWVTKKAKIMVKQKENDGDKLPLTSFHNSLPSMSGLVWILLIKFNLGLSELARPAYIKPQLNLIMFYTLLLIFLLIFIYYLKLVPYYPNFIWLYCLTFVLCYLILWLCYLNFFFITQPCIIYH